MCFLSEIKAKVSLGGTVEIRKHHSKIYKNHSRTPRKFSFVPNYWTVKI